MTGYVKTENMILIVMAALTLGFLGGVIFSAFRAGGMTSEFGAGNTADPSKAQNQAAIEALEQATRSNPTDVSAWTRLGHLYFDTGQPAKAITAYETSLSLDGNRPDVWTDLGVMFRRDGQPQKALDAFDRALAIDPEHVIALYNKGIVLMHDLNEPRRALAAWETLLEIKPDAAAPTGEPLRDIVQQLKKESHPNEN